MLIALLALDMSTKPPSSALLVTASGPAPPVSRYVISCVPLQNFTVLFEGVVF